MRADKKFIIFLIPVVLLLAGSGSGTSSTTPKDPELKLSAPTSQLAVGGDATMALTSLDIIDNVTVVSTTEDICHVTYDGGKPSTANQPNVHAIAAGECKVSATQGGSSEWNTGSQNVSFTIVAVAVTPAYTFIYSAAAGGSINTPCTAVTADASTSQCNSNATYFAGGNTVTAIPKAGYEFAKWSDNNSTNPVRTDTGANVNATATFQKKMITFTYVANENADIYNLAAGGSLVKCQDPCTKTFQYGDQTLPMIQYLTFSKNTNLYKGEIVGWGYINDGDTTSTKRHFITHGRTLPIQTATQNRTYYALSSSNTSGHTINSYYAGPHGHLQTRDPESQQLFDTQSFSFAVTSVTQVNNNLRFAVAPFAPSLFQSPPYSRYDYFQSAASPGPQYNQQLWLASADQSSGFNPSAAVPYLLDATTPISITGLADSSFNKTVEPSHNAEFSPSVTRQEGALSSVTDREYASCGYYQCRYFNAPPAVPLGGVFNGATLYYYPSSNVRSCYRIAPFTNTCEGITTVKNDDSFVFTLTPTDPGTTFSIPGGGSEYQLSQQGCCTFTVQPKGHTSHIVTIIATAEDGKSQKAISVELSHDQQQVAASISTFTMRVNGIDKSAGDTVILPIGTNAVTVDTNAGARATVDGATNLVPGNNIVKVTVLSPDGRGKSIQSFIAQVGDQAYFHPSSVSYLNHFPTEFTVPLNPGVNFQALTKDANGNPLNVLATTIPTPLKRVTQNPGDSSDITPLADKGYVFTGWTLSDGTTTLTKPALPQIAICDTSLADWSPLANDANCRKYAEGVSTANFGEAWYNVTASVIGHGTISLNGTQRIRGNDDFSYWVVPNEGYHIDSEILDGYSSPPALGTAGKLYALSNVTADHTLVEKFMPNAYTVHFDANFSSQPANVIGSITPPADMQAVPGSAITLPGKGSLNAGVDQIFRGWSATPTGEIITSTFTPEGLDANVTLYAIWGANQAPHTIFASSRVNGQSYNDNSSNTGIGGGVTPNGSSSFNYGDNATYTFGPQPGYTLDSVIVDGGAPITLAYAPGFDATLPRFSYTFSNVIHDHTIIANWVQLFTVTGAVTLDNQAPAAYSQQYISSPGVTSIGFGSAKTYTVASLPGYFPGEVFVDNVSQGQIISYTFTDVTASHTIKVNYIGIPVANTGFCTITYALAPGAIGTLEGTLVQRLPIGTLGSFVTASGGLPTALWSDGLFASSRQDSCTSDITFTVSFT